MRALGLKHVVQRGACGQIAVAFLSLVTLAITVLSVVYFTLLVRDDSTQGLWQSMLIGLSQGCCSWTYHDVACTR